LRTATATSTSTRDIMKKTLITAALALPLLASAQNLLTNGSFESGLTGWTVTNGPATVYPVSTVEYNALPGAFGEIVPPDNNASNISPDAVGMFAAYFVDDAATQSISQEFTVVDGGLYNLGLSLYAPLNGSLNLGDVTLTLSYPGGLEVVPLSGFTAQVWFGNTVTRDLAAGVYTFSITFAPQGTDFGKDLLVDRVHVTAVPEPGTYALFAAGLGIMGLVAARRRRD
jgi:hypothetical protein